MQLEVVTSDDYLGGIVGDLNARRGKIEGMEMRGGSRVIKGLVPAGRDVRLRHDSPDPDPGPGSLFHGVIRYEIAPAQVAEEIIARIEGRMPAHR